MLVSGKIKKEEMVSPFIKIAVDVETGRVAYGGELHVDCAEELIVNGSLPKNVWGANIYPDGKIDYVSLINIRPLDKNLTMGIGDAEVRGKIAGIMKEMCEADIAENN